MGSSIVSTWMNAWVQTTPPCCRRAVSDHTTKKECSCKVPGWSHHPRVLTLAQGAGVLQGHPWRTGLQLWPRASRRQRASPMPAGEAGWARVSACQAGRRRAIHTFSAENAGPLGERLSSHLLGPCRGQSSVETLRPAGPSFWDSGSRWAAQLRWNKGAGCGCLRSGRPSRWLHMGAVFKARRSESKRLRRNPSEGGWQVLRRT